MDVPCTSHGTAWAHTVEEVAPFPSLTHVALTVSDLDRSVVWYEALFGCPPIGIADEATYRYAVWLQPLFGLHEHREGNAGPPFNERRLGLDHVAFGCESRDELESWRKRLDELGIEHGGIVDAFYGSGLAFRDPDNIQLEFFLEVGES
jgi:glyoxylase I family protein